MPQLPTRPTRFVLGSCLVLAGACIPSVEAPPPGGGSGGTMATGGSGSPANSGGATGTGGFAVSGGTGGIPVAGSGGSGDAGNTGGAPGTGGGAGRASTGSGGAMGSGGATTGSGGTPGGGGSGAGGNGMTAACTFTPTASTSTKIPTVGIVTWSTTLAGVQSAQIEFGLTTTYGMTAPVDLAAPSYRTLLLGMKASKTYHYRIVASGGGSSCTSGDYTIATGALVNGLPKITAKTNNAAALSRGFLITGQYVQNAGTSGAPAYILDADAEIVWWYSIGSDVTGAKMSYDGKWMWINRANVPSGTSNVHRVSMDGMTDDNLSTQFAGQNHQLTVLPDETVAFYAYGSNGCDDIKERSPTGTVKTIANSRTAAGTSGACHVNTIQYSKPDDTLVFSDLDHNNYTKVTRTGTTVWVWGGTTSTITGDSWKGGQHGVHILGVDTFLFFANNSVTAAGSSTSAGGTGNGSSALELKLDLTAKSAKQTWAYKANPGIQNDVMGDVQRTANGNTVIGFSTKGVVIEVDASGAVVQELSWPLGASFGYIEKRPTLYGPPPR